MKENIYTEEALGHNHEWEQHEKEGYVFCWICNREKPIIK